MNIMLFLNTLTFLKELPLYNIHVCVYKCIYILYYHSYKSFLLLVFQLLSLLFAYDTQQLLKLLYATMYKFLIISSFNTSLPLSFSCFDFLQNLLYFLFIHLLIEWLNAFSLLSLFHSYIHTYTLKVELNSCQCLFAASFGFLLFLLFPYF